MATPETRGGYRWQGRRRQNPLMMAMRGRQQATAELLLERGADIMAKNKNGTTPLMWAAIARHQSGVILMLKKGPCRGS